MIKQSSSLKFRIRSNCPKFRNTYRGRSQDRQLSSSPDRSQNGFTYSRSTLDSKNESYYNCEELLIIKINNSYMSTRFKKNSTRLVKYNSARLSKGYRNHYRREDMLYKQFERKK